MEALPPATPPLQMITATFPAPVARPSIAAPRQDGVGDTESALYLPSAELREDPFERLRLFGPDYLRLSELLALAIRPAAVGGLEGTPEQLAQRILSEYGARALAAERNPGRLAELLGVTTEIAARIVAILELGRRFFEEPTSRNPFIRGPEDAYRYLSDMVALKKEHLRGLYLNVQSRLIHDEVISIGTLSRSVVHPREVFAPALEHAAHALILAHNHPSGDMTPSDQDIAVTRQIAQAGRVMGIELVDHLIIGSGGFVSLKKNRVL